MTRTEERRQSGGMAQFTASAEAAAADVVRSYSTSFGLATRLLGRRHRQHIRNVYALVRIADEIVDGVGSDAGFDASAQQRLLDEYEQAAREAVRTGYSSDLVLHAFARTARTAAIGEDLTAPFFSSMRTDAVGDDDPVRCFDSAEHERYVHGSAEVVGLMCLAVFLREEQPTPEQRRTLEHGACQLGAAFQNVNFLRDLAHDTDRLGRSYLSATERLDDARRDEWVAVVRAQLDAARRTIPMLPRDCRAAVRSALALFAAVTDRVSRTPAEQLYRRRVRVPNPVKIALALREVLRTRLERR